MSFIHLHYALHLSSFIKSNQSVESFAVCCLIAVVLIISVGHLIHRFFIGVFVVIELSCLLQKHLGKHIHTLSRKGGILS